MKRSLVLRLNKNFFDVTSYFQMNVCLSQYDYVDQCDKRQCGSFRYIDQLICRFELKNVLCVGGVHDYRFLVVPISPELSKQLKKIDDCLLFLGIL